MRWPRRHGRLCAGRGARAKNQRFHCHTLGLQPCQRMPQHPQHGGRVVSQLGGAGRLPPPVHGRHRQSRYRRRGPACDHGSGVPARPQWHRRSAAGRRSTPGSCGGHLGSTPRRDHRDDTHVSIARGSIGNAFQPSTTSVERMSAMRCPCTTITIDGLHDVRAMADLPGDGRLDLALAVGYVQHIAAAVASSLPGPDVDHRGANKGPLHDAAAGIADQTGRLAHQTHIGLDRQILEEMHVSIQPALAPLADATGNVVRARVALGQSTMAGRSSSRMASSVIVIWASPAPYS